VRISNAKPLVAIFFAMCSLLPLLASASGISFGIETRVPPFVWKDGQPLEHFTNLTADQKIMWQSVQADIGEYREWGAQWNVITIQQSLGGAGQILWLRQIMEFHKQNGVDVALRLMEDPSVYKNLAQTPSPEFGYNKNYYDWVRSIAQAFGKQVIYYFIGNETELGVASEHAGPGVPRTPVTYDQYRKVLITAIKAIKSVDPGIMVGDAGFSDYSLALAVAADIDQRQGLSDAQAFWAKWKKSGGKPVEGSIGLYRLLHRDETKRVVDFVTQEIRDPAGSDVLQLHYYGGWGALPVALQWITSQMQQSRSGRPIVAAEVGFYVRSSLIKEGAKSYWQMDVNSFTPAEHAENTIKNFAILLGSGVQQTLYWHMRARDRRDMVVTLFEPTKNPSEFIPTPAAIAYRALANAVSGLSAAPPQLKNMEGMWQFHFTGARDVTVVWASQSVRTAMPANVKEIRDMFGKPVPKGQQLDINSHPIYLFGS
jgi:hypothetical protein